MTAVPNPQPAIIGFPMNDVIANAIIVSVDSGLKMCGKSTRVVGISRIPARAPNIALMGIIGMSGKNTGFLTVSLSEYVATQAISGLLQETRTTIDSQVIDGVGELTNIIAGGIKSRLANTPWQFLSITVPSVIIGADYSLSFIKGIEYVALSFEIIDDNANRFFTVSISLMQTA